MKYFSRWVLLLLSAVGLSTSACAKTQPQLTLDATPDAPVGFSYKTNWFAIKTDDTEAVLKLLSPVNPKAANWISGIKAAYDPTYFDEKQYPIFITPPLDGWTFVVGSNLPYPYKTTEADVAAQKVNDNFFFILNQLSSKFSEVQFFGSYRVVGFEAWVKTTNGELVRAFSFADGTVYANMGAQTKEEKQLKFIDLSGLSPSEAESKIFNQAAIDANKEGAAQLLRQPFDQQTLGRVIPSEGDATDIAKLWSIDPTDLPATYKIKSVGVVGFLPNPSF